MSENGDRPELPEGWEWKRLDDIARTSSGGTPLRSRKEYYDGGDIPWVKIGDLNDGLVSETEVQITASGLESSAATLLPAGTLLIAMYGSIGKLGILTNAAATNQAICAIRPEPEVVDRDFLFWYLMSQRSALLAAGYGGTQANISQRFLKALPIPVPPLDEQRRIVRRVELLLSEIDTGLEAGSRARAGVSRLLRATAEAEVRRLEEEGCQMVSAVELSADVPYSLAIGPFGSNLKVSDYADSGVPLVFVRNIRAEKFGDAGTKFVSHEKAAALRAHRVQGGDLLVTKMGDPPGDCAIYPLTAPNAIITSDCIRFEVDRAVARPDYVAALFLTAQVKKQVRERTKGVAQKKVSLKTFRSIHFPLPDLRRQDAVVARLNHVRDAQGALGHALQAAEAQGARLERSVFRAAFRGVL